MGVSSTYLEGEMAKMEIELDCWSLFLPISAFFPTAATWVVDNCICISFLSFLFFSVLIVMCLYLYISVFVNLYVCSGSFHIPISAFCFPVVTAVVCSSSSQTLCLMVICPWLVLLCQIHFVHRCWSMIFFQRYLSSPMTNILLLVANFVQCPCQTRLPVNTSLKRSPFPQVSRVRVPLAHL